MEKIYRALCKTTEKYFTCLFSLLAIISWNILSESSKYVRSINQLSTNYLILFIIIKGKNPHSSDLKITDFINVQEPVYSSYKYKTIWNKITL